MAVLPVYNMITVPDSRLYFRTDQYQRMTGRAPAAGEKVTVIVAKKELPRTKISGDSFYPIGVSGAIEEINEQGYLVIHLTHRVELDEVYVYPDKTIELTVSRRMDTMDLDETDAARRVTAVKDALLEFSRDQQWGPVLRQFVAVFQTLGDVGAAVNELCREAGYTVVEEYGGHGIGREFHEDPFVSFVSERGTGPILVPGMCFTIEPMVNAGAPDITTDKDNGWIVRTADGSDSAQWEVQLVVTEDGYELLSW